MDKSITFVFSSLFSKPTGGPKVVFEYANRLVNDDWSVHIAYKYPYVIWRKNFIAMTIDSTERIFRKIFRKEKTARDWFNLDLKIKESFPKSLNYKDMPHTSLYVATGCDTAQYVSSYPVENSHKFYLVQDYETWIKGWTGQKVRQTYHYPLTKFVVSRWLKTILDEEKEDCIFLPNGFDFSYFRLIIPYDKKDKYSISLLYHESETKGLKYSIDALNLVKQKYPQLKAKLFGVQKRPKKLANWMEYYQQPDKITHNRIYNESAIFISSSILEGWGLTIGEAMICGAAIVCTDQPGFREMIIDKETGLLSPVKDSNSMADKIIRLIENDELRILLAKSGNRYIRKFTWDASYSKIVDIFNKVM